MMALSLHCGDGTVFVAFVNLAEDDDPQAWLDTWVMQRDTALKMLEIKWVNLRSKFDSFIVQMEDIYNG